MDKIPQQNKTNRVIFVQAGKIVCTSVINFLSAAISYKRIKTRIFALFWFFAEENTSTRLSYQQPLSVSQVTENDLR